MYCNGCVCSLTNQLATDTSLSLNELFGRFQELYFQKVWNSWDSMSPRPLHPPASHGLNFAVPSLPPSLPGAVLCPFTTVKMCGISTLIISRHSWTQKLPVISSHIGWKLTRETSLCTDIYAGAMITVGWVLNAWFNFMLVELNCESNGCVDRPHTIISTELARVYQMWTWEKLAFHNQ